MIGQTGHMRLHIEHDYENAIMRFWITEEREGGTIWYYLTSIEGREVIEKIDSTGKLCGEVKPKPFLTIPSKFGKLFVELICKAANEDPQYKTETYDHQKGQMEAMTLHLSDMRLFTKHLLKIKEPEK